jgi:hypothetical protein
MIFSNKNNKREINKEHNKLMPSLKKDIFTLTMYLNNQGYIILDIQN